MAKAAVKANPSVLSPADFHKRHDQNTIVPDRFRAGIKALGSTGWMYFGDFMRANQINPAQGAAYRENFKAFMLEADKKVIICGSAKQAAKFREAV